MNKFQSVLSQLLVGRQGSPVLTQRILGHFCSRAALMRLNLVMGQRA